MVWSSFKLRKEVVKLGRKVCKINSTLEQRVVFFKKKKEFKKLIKCKKQLLKQFQGGASIVVHIYLLSYL